MQEDTARNRMGFDLGFYLWANYFPQCSPKNLTQQNLQTYENYMLKQVLKIMKT